MLLLFLLVASYESRKIDDGPMHLVWAHPLNAQCRVAQTHPLCRLIRAKNTFGCLDGRAMRLYSTIHGNKHTLSIISFMTSVVSSSFSTEKSLIRANNAPSFSDCPPGTIVALIGNFLAAEDWRKDIWMGNRVQVPSFTGKETSVIAWSTELLPALWSPTTTSLCTLVPCPLIVLMRTGHLD